MSNIFAKSYERGSRHSLWVLSFMVFLLPIACWSLSQIHLKNDVSNWLPADNDQSELLAWYANEFHPEDVLLVSWDGNSLNDPRVTELTEAVRGKIDDAGVRRGGIPEIETVISPLEVINQMVKMGVDQDEAVNRLHGVLLGTGSLKVQLSDYGIARKTVH